MSNGLSKGNLVTAHQQFLEEMLIETQQSLAFARSVKEAKFIQTKITYLKQQLTKINGVNIGKRRTI